jgi:hypothetical protein
MTPEIAIDRVKLYLKWCSQLIDDLESGNAPVDGAVGWRRNGETWLPVSAWHQIFDDNEADEAAAELNRNGLLRTPDGPGLQVIVKVRNKTHRVYAVRQRISDWKSPERLHGYDGGNNGYLSAQSKKSMAGTAAVSASTSVTSLQPSDGGRLHYLPSCMMARV